MSHRAQGTSLPAVAIVSMNGTDVAVRISPHAVERYRERVRPALDDTGAAREFLRTIENAEIRTSPPVWLGRTSQRPAFYICIADNALPADPDGACRDRLVVRTVLTPSFRTPTSQLVARRRRRNIKAAERREARARRAERDRRRSRRARNGNGPRRRRVSA